ncbi:AzlD domain-containing protein [Candidatus Puniceispirillum sp.]|jgi:branched-subunit amino acid transport protein|uniref:AzlD domain-containing protein n=1 Tax=Candidatus Puniceispirillum sp. TaxID=2026719 RepID=UPI001EB80E12|nr:AzlD domain-containing protein [Candidatus Puniceispirillum sp.]MBT6567112.1 AzlD domain-containing protein [Candidatus Puniceispirillum sp.]
MNNLDYTTAEAWLAVCLACLGTFGWRLIGVVLAGRIATDTPMMTWINGVAYAMVSGVLMLILVYPTGILATTELDHRFIGLFVGLGTMILTKNLFYALCTGLGSFAIIVTVFN